MSGLISLGQIGLRRVAKTANFTVAGNIDEYLCTGSITATLGSAGYHKDRVVIIRNAGTGLITISGTISGVASAILLEGDSVQLASDGTNIYSLNPKFSTFNGGVAGDLTATTIVPLGAIKQPGKVVSIVGSAITAGVDGSNPLSVAFDLRTASPDGSFASVCSTNADIAKAAGDFPQSTGIAGTGITLAVLKTDGTEDLAAGDIVDCSFTLTRTASPGTEISGAGVTVSIQHY